MNLSNVHGLPQPLFDAIANDQYDPGDGDITVTALIQPPQLRMLKRIHKPVEDASDRLFSLDGQADHLILERTNTLGWEKETRLYTVCEGWKVGGKFDLYQPSTGVLADLKRTSVWAKDGKSEWEQQLNLLRVLLERNDRQVRTLQIWARFRDWNRSAASRDEGYPRLPWAVLTIPMWPMETAEAFLETRVRMHQAQTPPPCTDEERWVRPEKFAVMKIGRKTAVKLFDKLEEAQRFINQSRDKELLDIQHRPKVYARCEGFCPVAPVCPQLKAEADARVF